MTRMIPRLRVGDWGTALQFQFVTDPGTPIDISQATSLTIKIKRPDGSSITRALSFITNGQDGWASYTVSQGDLSLQGQYQAQGYLVMPSGAWTTTMKQFFVDSPL